MDANFREAAAVFGGYASALEEIPGIEVDGILHTETTEGGERDWVLFFKHKHHNENIALIESEDKKGCFRLMLPDQSSTFIHSPSELVSAIS